MLHGADEAGQGHEEQEDPHPDDAAHHLEAGHQAEPLPPRGDPDHQQAHHLNTHNSSVAGSDTGQ